MSLHIHLNALPVDDMIKYKLKTCPVCRKPFKVAANKTSRYFPPSSQKFCSYSCADKARYRRGATCRKLNTTDAAYLAGFLDGEGSVMLISRGSKRESIGLRVVIAQSEKSRHVLDWITEITGIGNITAKKAQNIHQDNGLTWTCHSRAAEGFLRQIAPFLRIKAEQAQLGIDFQSRLREPTYKADTVWQKETQNIMKDLNKRGKIEFTYQLTCASGG